MNSNKGLFTSEVLKEKQRELLAKLLEDEGILALEDKRVRKRKPGEDLQLSFAQQRLWFLDQLEPGNTAYVISRLFRITGPVNVNALEQALNEIVRRHESLRTIFTVAAGPPLQAIVPFAPTRLKAVDLTAIEEEAREHVVSLCGLDKARGSFDLTKGPLFRAGLLRLGADNHALLISMHHIISDGWSMGVFAHELGALLRAYGDGCPSPLADLPIQYADFALWQREQLQSEALEEQLCYWRRQLDGIPPVLQLPIDSPRPAAQSYAGKRQSFELQAGLTTRLKEISRAEQSTLYMTLLGAFAVLLSYYTRETDIPIGSPIAGRNQPEVEPLIGFFINMLVMRIDCGGDPCFGEFLRGVREVCLGAYSHQEAPFEKLVEELEPERSLNHSPFFQAMFTLSNVSRRETQLGELRFEGFEVDSGTSKFDLSLWMKDEGDSLVGAFIYNDDLFEEETIHRMCGHWKTLIESIAGRPRSRLSELTILSPTETRQMLVEWNQTAATVSRNRCLHDLFEEQAAETPNRIALIYEDEHITYEELNRRANRLAHRLQDRGLGPEEKIGVLLERSIEMIVAMLAALKAGGAYVPLDASYPHRRITYMLTDSGVKALLTRRRLSHLLPAGQESSVVFLDDEYEKIEDARTDNPVSGASPQNLAYVIYTSGSTGRPKGVAIEGRSAVTLLEWVRRQFTNEDMAGMLASTSICFDLSIFEIFAPLCSGGAVVLVDNVFKLSDLGAAHRVRLINTVPSAMNELLRTEAIPPSVDAVNLAGEALPNQLVQQIYMQTGVRRVWNLYGPSEDTTYSTAALIERGANRKPPIGRPIIETQTYILDRYHNPVPVGIAGELFIGGAGLARGYVHGPDLTAERFRPDRFSAKPGGRIYRTGDLAKFLPEGDADYLGRLDHQIKLRGYRIELGEIETVLADHHAVVEAAAIVREDRAGDKRLVAYVVADKGEEDIAAKLRLYLRERLPEYMTPQALILLEQMPLKPNGKIDRQALPEPDAASFGAKPESARPRSAVEGMVAAIWAEVLHIGAVGVDDSFFEIGGHSLLGVQVMNRINGTLHVSLPLRALFEAPTVALLSNKIIANEAKPGQTEKIAKILQEVMAIKNE